MLQPAGGVDLPEEPLGPEARRQLGVKHLERHRPVVAEVLGQPDRGHPAPPQLAYELIAVTKGIPELDGQVGHGCGLTEDSPNLHPVTASGYRRATPDESNVFRAATPIPGP